MKRWYFIFVFFFLLQIVSSEVQTIPPVKTSNCVQLPQSYANSTFQNITSIQLPDKNFQVINSAMTPLGGGLYNYSFCNTSQNGNYIVNGIGDIDGILTTWNYDFIVNPLGKTFTNAQAILYLLVFTVSVLLFLICTFLGIYLPNNNERDALTGYIIAVQNIKYFKMLCLALSYLILMLISYFGWMISYGYLDMEFVGKLFNFVFYSMLVLLLPLFIIGVYIVVSNVIRDNKIADALSMGLRIRE